MIMHGDWRGVEVLMAVSAHWRESFGIGRAAEIDVQPS